MISCRRCGGFMRRERDKYGAYTACVICGHVVEDMPPAAYEDHPARDGEPGTAERYMARRRAGQRKRYARRKAEA